LDGWTVIRPAKKCYGQDKQTHTQKTWGHTSIETNELSSKELSNKIYYFHRIYSRIKKFALELNVTDGTI
jgi:hypothetical protein